MFCPHLPPLNSRRDPEWDKTPHLWHLSVFLALLLFKATLDYLDAPKSHEKWPACGM